MSDIDAYEEEDLRTDQQLMDKLIYLACGTRPDIAFAVGQLSKHNADPQKSYLRAVKRVLRYLKSTMNLRLVYGQTIARDPPSYNFSDYADSNFARDSEDCKSVMSYCFFFNKAVVS